MKPDECYILGKPVAGELLGELRDSSQTRGNRQELKARLTEDGYVFLRQAVAPSTIKDARSEVFSALASVGEIAEPVLDGIGTDESSRAEMHSDLGAFWRDISHGIALRGATHGSEIQSAMKGFFSDPLPHDYLFLRPGRVGLSTRLHFDLPFFARGSKEIVTVWMALGEIPVSDGTLMIVEGSHRFDDLIEPVKAIDYDGGNSPTVQIMEDTVEFVKSRGALFLTADFGPGDILVFGMTTLHGTCDNHSPINRVRLSCDVRWQPATDPLDPRYAGDNPPGTTGAGYGELNGAKPLTADWHTR